MINLHQATVTAPRRRTGLLAGAGRDAGYVLAMLVLSIAGFWILTACVIATVVLLPTVVVGALVGVAGAYILRGVTAVDRRLAGWHLGRPVRGRYRRPTAPGVITLVKTVGSDPRTWKDACWVLGNSVAGLALGTVALVVTSATISYLTTPLWWWAVPDPHHNYAVLNLGIYTVTSSSLALLTSAIGLALLLPAIALNRRIASLHAWLARRALQS